MAAYALEIGGRAEVTAVLRSNFEAVQKKGFDIDSLEHGHDIKGWRPTHSKWFRMSYSFCRAAIGP